MLTPLVALAMITSDGSLSLPAIFADRMVLQRDLPIPVFGKATPGSEVVVELADRVGRTKAGPEGKWLVKLKALPASGPHRLQVRAGGETKAFQDVMVGEVWVASGQSNMEWPAQLTTSFQEDVAHPNASVRMITVERVSAEEPREDFASSGWVVASPTTLGAFSGVGYAFANTLQKALGVTVGIVHTSWGGTPAESWATREGMLANDATKHLVTRYLEGLKDYPAALAKFEREFKAWVPQAYPLAAENLALRHHESGFDDRDWGTFPVPEQWETVWNRPFDGAVWFRKEFDLPADWAGKDAVLHLGPVDDTDHTYVNGEKVGETGFDRANWWSVPRAYPVPGRLLKAGRNVIAVRVFDSGGAGGIYGQAEALRLVQGAKTISLAGAWRFKIEAEMATPSAEVLQKQPQRPFGPGEAWVPGGLWNAMIAPMVPYGIRGAIWYQGESNAGRAHQYRTLFPLMIQDWRRAWKQGDFPFLFVQLANFTERFPNPVESDWAELREAQTLTLKLRNTGMAVTVDIGEAADIHPRNKKDVGYRLAQWALAKTYKQPVVASGPLFRKATFEGGRARLAFDYADGLRWTSLGSEPSFQIAGEDRKWVWARAEIKGREVHVWSEAVAKPVAVRYGWQNNPVSNLENGAGLPASPFRTDDWPGLTVNNR